MGTVQIAVALLETEHVALGLARSLELADHTADVLEAGEHATNLEAVRLGDSVDHDRRHDRGDGHLALHSVVAFRLLREAGNVVEQKHASLVSGEQQVIIPVLYRDADAIGVGVRCDEQVGMNLFGKVDALLQGLADLRVRIRTCGEVPIGLGLLRNDRNVGDSHALEDARNALEARAVERRVHELERCRPTVLGTRDRARFDGVDVTVENVFANPLDKTLRDSFVEVADLHASERIYLGDCG